MPHLTRFRPLDDALRGVGPRLDVSSLLQLPHETPVANHNSLVQALQQTLATKREKKEWGKWGSNGGIPINIATKKWLKGEGFNHFLAKIVKRGKGRGERKSRDYAQKISLHNLLYQYIYMCVCVFVCVCVMVCVCRWWQTNRTFIGSSDATDFNNSWYLTHHSLNVMCVTN